MSCLVSGMYFDILLDRIRSGYRPALTGISLTEEQANAIKNVIPKDEIIYYTTIVKGRVNNG